MNFNLTAAWTKLQSMQDGLMAALPNIFLGLIVFIGFYIVANVSRHFVLKVNANHGKQNVGRIVARLGYISILLMGVLVTLSVIIPSFHFSDLITLLGIGGAAAAFAFKDILQNFLAGIILLIAQPFKVGDQIIVKSLEGNVEEIQMRATYIKTYDGRRVIIPNSDMITSAVTVNTAYETRRIQIEIGIGYGDDPALAKTIIFKALETIDEVQRDPAPDVLVTALADFSVILRVRWWVKTKQSSNVITSQDRVLQTIEKELASNGIDLPFPTQHILFHDQTEEWDGNRTQQREGWPAGKTKVPSSQRAVETLNRRHRDGGTPERDSGL